jgi:hypothetical protein
VWNVKEPKLLKATSAQQSSKFATLSPVMMTAASQLKNCSGGYKQFNLIYCMDSPAEKPPFLGVPSNVVYSFVLGIK